MAGEYEVILDGGGPWGIRLQGGKDFGVPLNVARVTPGSKAGNKRILDGDSILVINGTSTDSLTHMEAQNLIKNAGSRLQLKLKAGKGVSLGEVKQVGSGAFAPQASKTLFTTDVTHSAGVDHKYNSKPKPFGASASASTTVQSKKFDPAEYAKRKKEELEKYKEDQKKPVNPDSDVLKMLQNTSVSDNQPGSGSFSRLQNQLDNEGNWSGQEKSFKMTADGTDLSDVSPGSRQVMDDIKNRGSAGLSSSGRPSGGSRSFKVLQQMTNEDEAPPPPPPAANNAKPALSLSLKNTHMPLKGVQSNPIMDSLKSKMKEMNIDKDKLDRTHSISNKDRERGRYLSATSYESADRPPSPRPSSPVSPTSPMFRMTMEKGSSPGAGAFGSNNVIASLKDQLSGDRITLGLRQTRGGPKSPSLRHMQKTYTKKDQGQDENGNTIDLRRDSLEKSKKQEDDVFVDLPPPPPELMGDSGLDSGQASGVQSGTFNRLQAQIDAGTGDQVATVFSRPPGQRNQAVPAAPRTSTSSYNSETTANPMPKAPMPSGPNFKVGRAQAPTFKPSTASYNQPKPPPPPAVNAGEVVNVNSKAYNPSTYVSPSASSGYSAPNSFSNSRSPTSPPAAPPPPSGSANVVKTKGISQPVSSGGEKDLYCNACQQQLTGPFVSAIGKTWHPDHFCCSACSISLQNQAFVEENNQLFCEKCYNQYYAPKCAHCNNAIIGNCINALGKSWHPDHFVCSFCNRNFGNDGFLVDSGKPYCEKCFGDLFSVKCGKCARAITGGEKYVEALNKNWHSECFVCNSCNVRLEGNSFFVSRGMPYCQNHKSGV